MTPTHAAACPIVTAFRIRSAFLIGPAVTEHLGQEFALYVQERHAGVGIVLDMMARGRLLTEGAYPVDGQQILGCG
ncbi:hypothetical protein [Nocardia sp. GAS34]|uniref:hypothetical protein n=1 Tax=unclassified Nocardia TaxID=2637762 RepID=UPI003D1ED4EE